MHCEPLIGITHGPTLHSQHCPNEALIAYAGQLVCVKHYKLLRRKDKGLAKKYGVLLEPIREKGE